MMDDSGTTAVVSSLTKKLSNDWTAWNIGLDSSNIGEIFGNLNSFDTRIQLKLLVALLNSSHDEIMKNSDLLTQILNNIESVNYAEWNVWVPLIAKCVRRRLLDVTTKCADSTDEKVSIEYLSQECAEKIVCAMDSLGEINTTVSEEADFNCLRKYFFDSVPLTPSTEAIVHCKYIGDGPDFLSREIAVEENKHKSVAMTMSSGFTFK